MRLVFGHAFVTGAQHLRQRAPARAPERADRRLVAPCLHRRPLRAPHGDLPKLRRRVVPAAAHR